MHPSQIPEKPLVAGVNGKVEDSERIYFFERPDGSTLFAKGAEAWNLYSRRPQVLGRTSQAIKFIGSSSGEAYRQSVIDSQRVFREEGLEAAQERLRQGEREELEKARGNMIPPPNYDTVDKHGRPVDISKIR